MVRAKLLKILLAVGICLAASARADEEDKILDQRKELNQIQQEVAASREQLDSLKSVEVAVQKRIGEYDQRISSNRKVIRRLNAELEQLKGDIGKAETDLASRQDLLDHTRRRYLGNIRQFYAATHKAADPGLDRPNVELELNRQIVYLSALADFESGNVAQAVSILGDATGRMDQLSGERKKISKLKKNKETSTALENTKKRQRERDLEKIRRKKAAESDRILTLEQAAREMEMIIARLEQERWQRRADEAGSGAPSVFASMQGQLPAPYRGVIVVPFGNRIDEVTNLKSFSPGITIKGKAGRPVMATASGEIAYVGKLRGYGNFIIINHDGEYYTTYAGLGAMYVAAAEYVRAGAKVAVSGADGLVKFEIRQGREPLDPVKWVRIDSF